MQRRTGKPHLTWRIDRDLLAEVQAAVSRANWHATARGPGEAYTVRTWILAAVREKLDHLGRARIQRRRRRERNRARREESERQARSRAEMAASDGVAKNPAIREPTGAAA